MRFIIIILFLGGVCFAQNRVVPNLVNQYEPFKKIIIHDDRFDRFHSDTLEVLCSTKIRFSSKDMRDSKNKIFIDLIDIRIKYKNEGHIVSDRYTYNKGSLLQKTIWNYSDSLVKSWYSQQEYNKLTLTDWTRFYNGTLRFVKLFIVKQNGEKSKPKKEEFVINTNPKKK